LQISEHFRNYYLTVSVTNSIRLSERVHIKADTPILTGASQYVQKAQSPVSLDGIRKGVEL